MDELRRRLRDEMGDEHAPGDGHNRVVVRIHRRARARRIGAAGLGLALTGLLVAGIAAVGGPGGIVPITPGLSRPPSPTTEGSPSPEPPSPQTSPYSDPSLPEAPPPVTVRFFDRSVELHPYTYCYREGCVDGGPPMPLPHVGTAPEVTVEYPLYGWTFTAFFTPSGVDCGRVQSTPLAPNGDGTFTLEPVGLAGDYDVALFGEAPRGGDLSVAFRWTTPTDGPPPEPRAYLALLSNDDPVTSYGVELHVSNLETTPSSERARITVRASNGREIVFLAAAADRDCLPEGTVYWDGPDAKGLAAAALGDPPFTYEVELILDGKRYLATATWPQDEIEGEEPAVLLDFVPPLPQP